MTKKKTGYTKSPTVAELSAKLEPQQFSEIFCQAATTQKNIDKTLRDIVRDLIQKDHPTIASVKDLIKKSEKEEFWMTIKKGFSFLWTALVAIISGAIVYWFK